MDDGSGTTVSDRGGSHFDGTATDAGWVTGMNGHALSFNGSTSRVTIPAAAFGTISDQITIAMWVYGGTTQPIEDSIFFAANSSGTSSIDIRLPSSNSAVCWDAGNESGYDRISKVASADQFMGGWNHWIFTKDAATGTMNMYVNGDLFHTGSSNMKSIGGITRAFIGGHISEAGYDGTIDDVRLYNTALTSAEVRSLYLSSVNPYALWAGKAFSDAPDGTDQSEFGNPDGDRLINKLEWALVTDPLLADNPRLDTSVNNGNFVVQYDRRDASITGINVYATWAPSPSNITWRVHGDGLTEISNGWRDGVETISVLLPLNITSGFIRIRTEDN